MKEHKRLLIVQYAGDYRKAYYGLRSGEPETYYAQRYSVESVAEIGKQIEEVATLCLMTAEQYDEILEPGVRAIGAGFVGKINSKRLIGLIEKQRPTHLLLRTPLPKILHWAVQNKISTLVMLADSFLTNGLRQKIKNYYLAKLLNHEWVEWVGNHGINASKNLQEIGVNPDKIIPWDFTHVNTPDDILPKFLRDRDDCWNLIYVGSLIESKGVGDILEAIHILKRKNIPIRLKLIGKGEKESFLNQAQQLNIAEDIIFEGLVPFDHLIPLIRESDIIIVPSRHKYPEGFPLIIYHALSARTPIIASDHPMFKNKLKSEINAMIFPSGNSIALANSMEKLLSNHNLYYQLSVASSEAWQELQIPVKWEDLIFRWLNKSPENKQWLFEHRLSSGKYSI